MKLKTLIAVITLLSLGLGYAVVPSGLLDESPEDEARISSTSDGAASLEILPATAAIPTDVTTKSLYCFPVDGSGSTTIFKFANRNNHSSEVVLTAWDEDGSILETAKLTIAAHNAVTVGTDAITGFHAFTWNASFCARARIQIPDGVFMDGWVTWPESLPAAVDGPGLTRPLRFTELPTL